MAARHGRVARLPAGQGDPGPPAGPAAAGPQDPEGVMPGGREHASREELARLGEELVTEPGWRARWRRREAMTIVLDWLETFPGDSWQDRWLVSGSDNHGRSWGPAGLTQWSRNRITTGLGVLIVLRAVRPAYSWLLASRLLGVFPGYRQYNQAAAFAELAGLAARRGTTYQEEEALNVLTRVVIATGKDLRALSVDDLAAYAAAGKAHGRRRSSLPLAYELLRGIGGLPGRAAYLAAGPGARAAHGRRTGGPLPAGMPADPRHPGVLPDRTLSGAGLQLSEQSGADARQRVLG